MLIRFSFLLTILFVVISKSDVKSARILVIAPFGSKSHSLTCYKVAKALYNRGHEVHQIVVSAHSNLPGVKFIQIPKTGEKFSKEFSLYPHGNHNLNQFPVIWFKYLRALINTCKIFWEEDNILQLINKNATKFDIIIMDALLQECALPLSYKLNSPIIFMSANSLDSYTSWFLGVPTPYAHVPQFFTAVNRPMTFPQRIANAVTHLSYVILHHWYYLPAVEEIAKRCIKDLPPLVEVVKNVSGAMAAADKGVLLPTRPMMPNFVDITGITCEPAKLLPKDLQDLVDSSGEEGFILFSLGTIVESSYFPPDVLKSFLTAFSRLNNLVILKHAGQSSHFPPNVKALDWLPQNDLLGHPKIKLFIGHGGLHGLYEAIYHGVPFVGVGIYTDQRPNMIRSVERGFAVEIHENNISEVSVFEAVKEVLHNSRYKENAVELSKLLRDQPETPMDRATYFIEYVIRHKGAPHLKNNGAPVGLIEYFILDAISLLVLFIILFIAIFLGIFCKIMSYLHAIFAFKILFVRKLWAVNLFTKTALNLNSKIE